MKKTNKNNVLIDGCVEFIEDFSNYSLLACTPAQPAIPGLEVPPLRCGVCGKGVPAAKPMGRPRKFCSPDCAATSADLQQRAWRQSHALSGEATTLRLICKACGEAFPVAIGRRGRLPAYCSKECRARALAAVARARRKPRLREW